MKKRNRILLIGLIAVVLGGVAWATLRPREPVYQGKSFSVWLEQYQASFPGIRHGQPSAKREEAERAIRQIGTNALPTLLSMVRASDSPVKRKLIALADKQRVIHPNLHSDDYYHAKASYGFSILGPLAKPLVPALINALDEKNAGVRAAAAHSLGAIGPGAETAVPTLINHLNDRNDGLLIEESMMALGKIGEKSEIAVPALMEFVNGPRRDWNYIVPAIDSLRRFRGKARSASPALQELMNSPDPNVRNAALNALNNIDPEAAIKSLTKWRSQNRQDSPP